MLGNQEPIASIPGEIVANSDWYDYSAKYDEGGMELVIPPRVSQEAIERVQELSVAAFRATECEGMARADCFVRDDGEVLVNELNTIPGFTATSVYAKLFEASGIPYEELLDRLVQLALERHERRRPGSSSSGHLVDLGLSLAGRELQPDHVVAVVLAVRVDREGRPTR